MKYEEFKTAEEYLDWMFLSNLGTDSLVKKDELKKIAEFYDIEFKDNATKEELYKLVLPKITYRGMIREFNAGVSSYEYKHKFNITGDEVKRMERLGFITVSGHQTFRAYGRTLKANVYDVYEFYSLTHEIVQDFLRLNPKGTRKNNVKFVNKEIQYENLCFSKC